MSEPAREYRASDYRMPPGWQWSGWWDSVKENAGTGWETAGVFGLIGGAFLGNVYYSRQHPGIGVLREYSFDPTPGRSVPVTSAHIMASLDSGEVDQPGGSMTIWNPNAEGRGGGQAIQGWNGGPLELQAEWQPMPVPRPLENDNAKLRAAGLPQRLPNNGYFWGQLSVHQKLIAQVVRLSITGNFNQTEKLSVDQGIAGLGGVNELTRALTRLLPVGTALPAGTQVIFAQLDCSIASPNGQQYPAIRQTLTADFGVGPGPLLVIWRVGFQEAAQRAARTRQGWHPDLRGISTLAAQPGVVEVTDEDIAPPPLPPPPGPAPAPPAKKKSGAAAALGWIGGGGVGLALLLKLLKG